MKNEEPCSISQKCRKGVCLVLDKSGKGVCIKNAGKFKRFNELYGEEYPQHSDIVGTDKMLKELYKNLSEMAVPAVVPVEPALPKKSKKVQKSKKKKSRIEGEVIEERRADDIAKMLQKITDEDENKDEISEVQQEILKCLGI
jgi:hypothetical protein